MIKLPSILEDISKELEKVDAKAIAVGGAVRDHFLNLPTKDYDIEVYGIKRIETLSEILSKFGSVSLVGKSFGVLKLNVDGEEYDFSFPRTEKLTGVGHRAFDVTFDGTMSFQEAAKRRDFTINAMGYEIASKIFLDPFDAYQDMDTKRLRHIDDETFIEDPLRVYRAVQFSARFGYELSEDTLKLCRKMVHEGLLESLPKERVYMEWKKLLLKAPKPSVGFEVMRKLGIIHYFPELQALIGVEQETTYHPEGDVWIHTLMSLDAMAVEIANSREEIAERQKLIYMFAILCHDLGKPATTGVVDGRIRAIGHEKAGIEPTKQLMYRLMDEHDFIDSILPLVEHHLKPSQFYRDGAKKGAIRRLATKVNIEELVQVAKADFLGRSTPEVQSGIYEAGDWLLEQAKELYVDKKPLEHLIQGRDLIALGLKPSPKFKEILDDVYEKQMDGELLDTEAALKHVRIHYL